MAEENEDHKPRESRPGGKGRVPKLNLMVVMSKVEEGDKQATLEAYLFRDDGKPGPQGTPIIFKVDDEGVIGNFRTGFDGIATCEVELPEELKPMEIYAAAAIANGPYHKNIVNPLGEVEKRSVGAVDILMESLDLGDGKVAYYLAIVQNKRRFPTTGTITMMIPNAGLSIDGQKINSHQHTLTFSEPKGRVFVLSSDKRGVHEIDLVPDDFPANKREIKIPGPIEKAIKPGKNPSIWEIIFSGCR